jgi:hypothetical protein
MHNNAPVHTAYIVCDWLAKQEFETMIWPPYSPDLNPIENLWVLLKAKIYKLQLELKDMPDTDETLEFMIQTTQEAWSQIDISILENLADTMPHRVEDIIENRGWYTKY